MTDHRHICLISGGKDSSALAIYLRDRRPELPMEYVFCDTHKELPETYEFIYRLEAYLGRSILWLNPTEGDRAFDFWLSIYRDFLPSPNARWCTRQLKIKPFDDLIGTDPCSLYIGIRADEQREGYISTKPNVHPQFPFREDGIRRHDVERILQESGVGMPGYYSWRTRSGCYFCFYQRRIEWVGLKEHHPDLFEKAREYEKPDKNYTWIQGMGLDELARPERLEQIRREEVLRVAQREKQRRKRPACLAEAFAPDAVDLEDQAGCLICHL